jgi:predicted HD phosphohydrolase
MTDYKQQLHEGEDIALLTLSAHDFSNYDVDFGDLSESDISNLVHDIREEIAAQFVKVRRKKMGELKELVGSKVHYLTTAPENFDGFNTTTVRWLALQNRKGEQLREVAVMARHEEWQDIRYSSGNHLSIRADRRKEFEHLFQPIS